MIALFARQNHPHGFGYSTPRDYTKPGIGAHGYSVVGFRCRDQREVRRVLEHVRTYGIDLPDSLTGRTTTFQEHLKPFWTKEDGTPGNLHHTNIGYPGVARWYSGGPGDWDYLFTVRGSKVDWEWPGQAECGSRGDNRWCMVYDAKQLFDSKP